MKIKISKKDLVWSYLGYMFGLGTNLVLLPFIMRMVVSRDLGLWYTFLSIGTLVSLLDFGFSITLVRNITYAWSGLDEIQAEGLHKHRSVSREPNYKLFCTVLRACNYVCLFIAGLALLVMATVGTIYIIKINGNSMKTQYLYAWGMYCAAVFFNIYYNYWTSSLKGVGAIKESQKSIIFSKITQIVISLIGLFNGLSIIALSGAYLISGFVLRGMSKYYFYKYEQIHVYIKKYQKEITPKEVLSVVKKVWHNAKKQGASSLAAFMITQSTTLICSAYISLEATAAYGLCLQIVNALSGIAQTYFNTMVPKMTDLCVEKRNQESGHILSYAIFIYWLIFIVGGICIIVFGLPVIGIIKSDTKIPAVMLAFMMLYLALEGNHSLFATYISLWNTVPYVRASVVSGICIIIGEWICVSYTTMGIYGLMVVQCIVQLAYNNWKWPSVVLNQLNLNIIKVGSYGAQRLKKNLLDLKKRLA